MMSHQTLPLDGGGDPARLLSVPELQRRTAGRTLVQSGVAVTERSPRGHQVVTQWSPSGRQTVAEQSPNRLPHRPQT